jgi:cell division protein FtsW
MVYSASMVVAAEKGTPSYYFTRQSFYAGIGYLSMILLMFVDYHFWLRHKTLIPLATLSAVTLLLVFSQPAVKGAHRALSLTPLLSFQPSELAKLVLLFYLAFFLQKHRHEIRKAGTGLLPCLAVIGLFAGLIGSEPDLGQALSICAIAILLLFVAGLEWKYIWAVILSSVPTFFLLIWRVPFRRDRIFAWLAALQNPLSADYQTRQAAIAIARGGIAGVGFAESRQKFCFLPEAIGDFIYAVIGEELGFIGAILVAASFLGLLCLGIKVSINAPDRGGFYLGLGISLMLTLQAFINMSTALAIVPTKGLTLPFISQGGSSLVVSLMSAGILLNIASQRKTQEDTKPFSLSHLARTYFTPDDRAGGR